MRFLRCVHAEFLLVAPRLTRTRLGISLVALGATLVWLSARGFDTLTVTLQAGALGAVLGAAASPMGLGPSLWHYRDIATGDLGAILHAGAWSGLGILAASAFIARRHR